MSVLGRVGILYKPSPGPNLDTLKCDFRFA